MLDFLRREGIDPGIISAIEDFRKAHSVPEEVRRRQTSTFIGAV